MPNYDYECTHCGYKFEVFQNMSAQHLTKCPKCDRKVKRLIGSGAGIIFKGKGFYATDYAKKSKNSDADSPKISCPKALALAKGGQTKALWPSQGCSGCPKLT